MKTLVLAAALAAIASPAWAFGPASAGTQFARALMRPIDQPSVCLPDYRHACTRLAPRGRQDSNWSEALIRRR